jgi:hypothetical protein
MEYHQHQPRTSPGDIHLLIEVPKPATQSLMQKIMDKTLEQCTAQLQGLP